jgi:hypothetical protein
MPNNTLPISNEAVRYDLAIIDDPLKDTISVKPLNSPPQIPVPAVIEED